MTFRNRRLTASTGARDRRLRARLIGLDREAIVLSLLSWSSSLGSSGQAQSCGPARSVPPALSLTAKASGAAGSTRR